MKDVSHTNPYTGDTAGHLFTRGPTVAADGGRPDDADAESTSPGTGTVAEGDEYRDGRRDQNRNREQTMKDVSHTPPHDATDANRVFERGGREVGHGERDDE